MSHVAAAAFLFVEVPLRSSQKIKTTVPRWGGKKEERRFFDVFCFLRLNKLIIWKKEETCKFCFWQLIIMIIVSFFRFNYRFVLLVWLWVYFSSGVLLIASHSFSRTGYRLQHWKDVTELMECAWLYQVCNWLWLSAETLPSNNFCSSKPFSAQYSNMMGNDGKHVWLNAWSLAMSHTCTVYTYMYIYIYLYYTYEYAAKIVALSRVLS